MSNPGAASGPTMELASWVASFGGGTTGGSSANLPEAVDAALRLAVLDTLGCAVYGRELEWSTYVRRWAEAGVPGGETGTNTLPSGRARVWGSGADEVGGSIGLRPSDAAFVNGIAAHAFELDDYHPVKIHPGAVVVPAVLALGEALGADGPKMLRAIGVGYEVMARTSAALDPSSARLRGWHLTGVTGTFAAAAAASVLLDLDQERTAWALGLAGTQSSGLFAFTSDGAMSKRFHAGDAARAGIVAAELAQQGFSGPTAVYEAEDGGFLNAFADVPGPEHLTADLGTDWRLLDMAFKPYSCCGSLHSYVDAALSLRDAFVDKPDATVRIGLPKVVEVQCGFDYEPGSVLSAQMNARFCVATALQHGAVLPAQFADEQLIDPRTLSLQDRIEQVHDEALDDIYPAQFCGWVELDTGNGPARREFRLEPSGAATNPNKPDAMIAKFRQLVSHWPAERASVLEAQVLAFEGTCAGAIVTSLARS